MGIAAGERSAGRQSHDPRITALNDIFLDGIRDFGSYYRDSFNYHPVEVLEGPAGVQFGRGSSGGVINQESEVPAARAAGIEYVHLLYARPHRRDLGER